VIALDLSRLLSRAGSATPSGIDRVELAYARHLGTGAATHCFVARNNLGGIGLLPTGAAGDFIGRLAALWRDGATVQERRRLAALARWLRIAALAGGPALRKALRESGDTALYLLVSHQNLDRSRPIAGLKSATGARFVCLIHDLIPLDFPKLTRSGQTVRHRRRIATVAALADAVIVNSAATREALRARLGDRDIPVAVAPLGIDLPEATQPDAGVPYFICIGTIERRKNHKLLFDVWQRLAAELGQQTPRLILIGQRGFGGEEIAGYLGTMHDIVVEHSDLPDAAMAGLLRGARALLLPSLAEGFGLPVIEALAHGVPVLCSDLPALHESGDDVPDYLDPHKEGDWRTAILDFLTDSPRQQAQLARLAQWRPPSWPEHFALVERLIAAL
jgi:glycosyltransferase involved in cell wall biosynthesis